MSIFATLDNHESPRHGASILAMISNNDPIHHPSPMRAGLLAARANLIPGLIVQTALLAIVMAYYFSPAARPWFLLAARWKEEWGVGFAMFFTMIAGGLLPEILRVVVFQNWRVEKQNWRNLVFAMPVWAFQGACVDYFYRGQAIWFGNNAHWLTILEKVCVDQFLYNPLFASPFGVTIYEWKNRGYRWSSEFSRWAWYRDRVVPALVATWAVWIPVVSITYCLPQTLQIPVFTLALTFWVSMFTWMCETLAKRG